MLIALIQADQFRSLFLHSLGRLQTLSIAGYCMPMQFCNASRPSKSVESKRDRPTQKIGVVHQKIRRVICRDGCFHVLRPPENPKPQKSLAHSHPSGEIGWEPNLHGLQYMGYADVLLHTSDKRALDSIPSQQGLGAAGDTARNLMSDSCLVRHRLPRRFQRHGHSLPDGQRLPTGAAFLHGPAPQ